MSFIAKLHRARAILEQNGRLSTRALERELGLGGDELDELVEELVHVQQVARLEGKILIWGAAEVRGAPSPSAAADSRSTEARKVVTIVFADLVGSTALHERLDPESVSRFMDDYYRTVRTPVEAHGGSVIQLLGDGVMCAFGVPRVAEDDAIRAVRAAVAMQRAFAEFAAAHGAVAGAIGLRVAVNTGEVVVSDDHPAGIGDPLNVAARLQQEARDGDVLIGESTARLVRERVTLERVGTFSLKGRAETVTAYRVVSVERPAGVPATAFVGREEEIGRLLAVYETAVSAPGARLAVVLGSPGLGKSRLLVELARRFGDRATVLTAQCDAAGGATFAPLAGALRAHLRLDGGSAGEALRAALAAALPGDAPEPARIVGGIAALLAGAPAPPEETFFVVRRLLAGLASVRPVVLALDDLQWAEPLLLDLVEHLVQWGAGTPLLVLAAARPDLRDSRSSLARSGGLVSEVVTLAGLDAAAATRLAANVIGTDVLPAAVAGRVLATSEGNPLFVGELVRMLVDDGALVRDGYRWTVGVELAALEMPPTIQALLAARIERLGVEERTVLERAAVLGRQFSRAAVAHLLPAELRASLDARLETLRRTELIEPDNAWFLGEPALRFHHGLTRDAAYRRVLKGTRAELHARSAEWIASRSGDAIEHDETIGWHLEQAHQNLRELGPLDARGRALGERASRHLATAGRRALARDDLPVAANLLGRAVELLDRADPQRADLALDWCEALLAAGDVGPAAEAVAELGRFASAGDEDRGSGVAEGNRQRASSLSSSDPDSRLPTPDSLREAGRVRLRAWHTCFAGELAVLTDPQALRATAEAVAAAAEELAAAGDTGGEAKARSVQAMALSRLGRVGASEAALDQALAAARRANDRRRSNAVLAGAPLAALYGPSPVTRASGRCLDVVRVLRITLGAPGVEAVALRCQAVLEALRGRADAARRMIESSRRMVEELGITHGVLETEFFAGLIGLIEGDNAAAEHRLRAAYEGLRAHGLGIDAARAAAMLGRALLPQGRAAEAEALSHESEALAGDDLQAAITWRRVRAEALARRGEHAAAVDLARAAVDIAAGTDALLHHAEARLALAAALRAAGRHDEAAAEQARAIELWEAKGATVLAERARRAATEPLPRPLSDAEAGGGIALSPPEQGVRGLGPQAAAIQSIAARRRVRPNAMTAGAARLDAAMATRDADALRAIAAEAPDFVTVDHPNGCTYDAAATLRTRLAMLKARDLTFRHEPLATLGDSLALLRMSMSASGLAGATVDIGAYTRELIILVDGPGRRGEMFADDRLGDAIARLYERYAELLPEGPECIRAAAVARSVAAAEKLFLGPDHFATGIATAFASDFEMIDHRTAGFGSGDAQLLRRIYATTNEMADDLAGALDDVLGVHPIALLTRWTAKGRDREGGGAFEWPYLLLSVFGADGLVKRSEVFDVDKDVEAVARFDELCQLFVFGVDGRITRWEQFEAECRDTALARFDEIVASRAPRYGAQERGSHSERSDEGRTLDAPQSRRRRVRANAATANAARLCAAVAARDSAALSAINAADLQVVHHPTHAVYGADDVLRSYRALIRARDGALAIELLAALGESLALYRHRASGSEAAGGKFDVGAFEIDQIALAEVDAQGRARHVELFAEDRLDDAVARLYERYADTLPEGPERSRAAARARALALALGPYDTGRHAAAIASDVKFIDHRLEGAGSLIGAEATLRWFRSLLDAAEAVANRLDDILALASNALLMRWTNFGTERAGGGVYERHFLWLGVLGSAGLVERIEQFGPDSEAEALARFDALIGSTNDPERDRPPLPRGDQRGVDGRAEQPPLFDFAQNKPASLHDKKRGASRRVRANAASVLVARFQAAFARGDDVHATIWSDDILVLDHPTGASYGYEARVRSFRQLAQSSGPRLRLEPLATLGDSLVLCRSTLGARGTAHGSFDVGEWEREDAVLFELGEDGRCRRVEIFAGDHLVDAIARLRERYAELLPEGPARTRAAAIARLPGLIDPVRIAAALSPSFECIDHRILGTWSASGPQEWLVHWRAQLDLAGDFAVRVDDVLALEPGGFLARQVYFGMQREGGGAFENVILSLSVFGADGLLTSVELFDPDQEAEALARFDELVGSEAPHPAEVFANAASRSEERMMERWAARDWNGVVALFSPALRFDDRRRLVRLEIGGDDFLAQYQMLFDQPGSRWHEPLLATRGERLSLHRVLFQAEVAEGGGPLELDEHLALIEVDAEGRQVALVAFDLDDEDAAWAELDARFQAGEASTFAPGVATLLQPFRARDWDAAAALLAPGFVLVDHRPLGWGQLDGPTYVESLKALVELSPDARLRCDHEWRCERGAIGVFLLHGTREGGAFDEPRVVVLEYDASGHLARQDHYTLDQLDAARARYAELARVTPAPAHFANAASRTAERLIAAWRARDRERLAQLLPPTFRYHDRQWHLLVETDRDQYLDSVRHFSEMDSVQIESELLGTRGERLALYRGRVVLAGGDVGPSEIPYLSVIETDERGVPIALADFDADAPDAAWAQLDAGWEAGEGAALGDAVTRFGQAFAARDWEAVGALCAPTLVEHDHRRITGLGTTRGIDAWVEKNVRMWVELAPDTVARLIHLRRCDRGALLQVALQGSRDEGRFEIVLVGVGELDARGRFERIDVYDPEQLDAAFARFAELQSPDSSAEARRAKADALRIPPNAATRAGDCRQRARQSQDWDALADLYAPGLIYDDRRSGIRLTGNRDTLLASSQHVRNARDSRTLLATAGERLALERVCWHEAAGDPAFEIETLTVCEVDEDGRIVAQIQFDRDDRRAAAREMLERYARSEAGRAAMFEPARAVLDHDLERCRAAIPADFVFHDHRRCRPGRVEGAEAWIAWLATLFEQSPDSITEPLRYVAGDQHGTLHVGHTFGTLPEGGAFESPFVCLWLYRDGRVVGCELFEPEDLDRARARFEELRAADSKHEKLEIRRSRNPDDQNAAPAAAMTCPQCGGENPAGKKFCGECGASLAASEEPKAEGQTTSAQLTTNNLATSTLARRAYTPDHHDPHRPRRLDPT